MRRPTHTLVSTGAGIRRIALVIGADTDVGHCIARRLAADGHAIVAHHQRRPAQAARLVDGIVAAGGDAFAIAGDVAAEADVAALFAAAERRWGPVDVVVNNPLAADANADAPVDVFDRFFGRSLRGTLHALGIAARRLRPGGVVVNLDLRGNEVGYVESGDALRRLGDAFERELAERGISLHCAGTEIVDRRPRRQREALADAVALRVGRAIVEAETPMIRSVPACIGQGCGSMQ